MVDHLDSLLKFGLELHDGFADHDWASLDVFLEVIEAGGQREEGPAFLDDFENTDGDDILGPSVLRLIFLGSVVEEVMAAEDLVTGFGIDEVIEGEDDAVSRMGIWDQLPGRAPEIGPGEFWRSKETVESTLGDTNSEEMFEETKNIGGSRRREWHSDGEH